MATQSWKLGEVHRDVRGRSEKAHNLVYKKTARTKKALAARLAADRNSK